MRELDASVSGQENAHVGELRVAEPRFAVAGLVMAVSTLAVIAGAEHEEGADLAGDDSHAKMRPRMSLCEVAC